MFYFIFKCLDTFEVTEAAHRTAVLLSLYIMVLVYAYGIPMLLARCFMNCILVVHSLVVNILASQELRGF